MLLKSESILLSSSLVTSEIILETFQYIVMQIINIFTNIFKPFFQAKTHFQAIYIYQSTFTKKKNLSSKYYIKFFIYSVILKECDKR